MGSGGFVILDFLTADIAEVSITDPCTWRYKNNKQAIL